MRAGETMTVDCIYHLSSTEAKRGLSCRCETRDRLLVFQRRRSSVLMLSSRPAYIDVGGHTQSLFAAKTPGKMTLKSRNALQENSLRHGTLTGNANGKKVASNNAFQPRTLRKLLLPLQWAPSHICT